MQFLYGILWAIGVALVVYLLGGLLLIVPPVYELGSFLQSYAWLIGVAAGIFYVVGNKRWFNR